MTATLDTLRVYVDLGWSIIPIRHNEKTPLVSWTEYRTTPATFEQLKKWDKQFNSPRWAVITGKISNLFIVDCDNEEALIQAETLGLTNGCSVTTPNGKHFYFNFLDDGNNRKTISGHGSKGTYWPQVKGLDARAEGGYALLPPSNGYEWDIEEESIVDEITDYNDWPGATFEEDEPDLLNQPIQAQPAQTFSDIDLSNTTLEGSGKTSNATREKFEEIVAQIPEGKIARGGSGIHDATYNFLAEEALLVGLGPELEQAGHEFMEQFFAAPLTDGRFETSLETIREKERRNHPERFDANGVYTYHLRHKQPQIDLNDIGKLPQVSVSTGKRFLVADDAAEYAVPEEDQYWQEPWLRKASIIQVYGYSGHGKSMFLQHALHHAACDLNFGCFPRAARPKILYMDFENGKATWGKRVDQMRQSFGNSKDNLHYWTPWLNDSFINLREQDGIIQLQSMLVELQPDILVIDTLRSAYPGLHENSAEDWSAINQLALKIRNAGCTVILVHHSNKPDKDGLGREAGSSNQLTVLETQLRVTQVFNDKDLAKTKGGLFSGDLQINPYQYMHNQMPRNSVLQMVFELSYGKVREWTDLHDPKQYIGIAIRPDGQSIICNSPSPRERLKILIRNGTPRDMIIGKMGRPLTTLEEWADQMKIVLP